MALKLLFRYSTVFQIKGAPTLITFLKNANEFVFCFCLILMYSEVPNRRADRNKRAGLGKSATLLAYFLSKLINEQGGIFHLLHEKLQAGWKKNLKNLSKHALHELQSTIKSLISE